jgi:hypothetical protein
VGAVIVGNGRSGFIDASGVQVIPPKFEGLGMFHSGLCSKGSGGGVGYIDHFGDWFIDPRFLIAAPFSEGCAFASLDGETFGFIKLSGAFAISPQFQQCRSFSEGLAACLSG